MAQWRIDPEHAPRPATWPRRSDTADIASGNRLDKVGPAPDVT
jgi:hypothetical protein